MFQAARRRLARGHAMQETHEREANVPVQSEDQARADFYALLARLYAAAPDAALLSSIAACDELSADAASEGGRALADAWRKLIAASTARTNVRTSRRTTTTATRGVGRNRVRPKQEIG